MDNDINRILEIKALHEFVENLENDKKYYIQMIQGLRDELNKAKLEIAELENTVERLMRG